MRWQEVLFKEEKYSLTIVLYGKEICVVQSSINKIITTLVAIL